VEGHHQKGEARLHAGSLENIRIADGKVFIAELACTKP
jgi:hypothetical protein